MVQRYRSRPNHPGNIVAQVIDGVGARGSSLSDVDNLTVIHDGGKGQPRFLFQELKHGDEPLDKSQEWILRDLATLPGVEAWTVRLLSGQRIEWTDHAIRTTTVIPHAEYREKVSAWWGRRAASLHVVKTCPHGNAAVEDCDWCWREAHV